MGNCVSYGNKKSMSSDAGTNKRENITAIYINHKTSNASEQNTVTDVNPKGSNKNENKSEVSKATILNEEKRLKTEYASRTISNPKNLQVKEHQKCDESDITHVIESLDSDTNSSRLKEEQEIAKENFAEINGSDNNQQTSEPKVPELPKKSDSSNRYSSNSLHTKEAENINSLSKSEISISPQESTKEFEETGNSGEYDKYLHSLLEDSRGNQIRSTKNEDKLISSQETTEESEEICDSKEAAEVPLEKQIRSTKNEDEEISAQETTEESAKISDSREVGGDSHKNEILSTEDEDKQKSVQLDTEETGDSKEAAEVFHENQIPSTKNKDEEILSAQESTEKSENRCVSRQVEEDSYKTQIQSTKDEEKQITEQENPEESEKTGHSGQADDSYKNQIPELSEANMENNSSFLSNEEQSAIQEQQEADKPQLQKSPETNILNLQEYFTNSDPSNITYQKDSVEYILEIEERAKKFEDKVTKYSGTNYSVDYFVIDENLTRFVECLDKVKLQDEHLLKEKIRVIDYIRSLQLRLDENVTEK